MNSPGEQFLACAGLAHHQNVAPRVGNLLYIDDKSPHDSAVAQYSGEIKFFCGLTADCRRISARLFLKRFSYAFYGLVIHQRLEQIVRGAAFAGLKCTIESGIGRHDDKSLAGVSDLDRSQELDAVHPRQCQFREDQVIRQLVEQLHRSLGIAGAIGFVSFLEEYPLQGLTIPFIGFNDQKAQYHITLQSSRTTRALSSSSWTTLNPSFVDNPII